MRTMLLSLLWNRWIIESRGVWGKQASVRSMRFGPVELWLNTDFNQKKSMWITRWDGFRGSVWREYGRGWYGKGREILTRTSARGNKLRHIFNKNSKQQEGKDAERFRRVGLSPSCSQIDEDTSANRFFISLCKAGLYNVEYLFLIITQVKCHPQSSLLKLITLQDKYNSSLPFKDSKFFQCPNNKPRVYQSVSSLI
jgi:hypothetical protein